ncbi:MAG: UDP-N-acetylglucosamine--N-acetylmuramyl-(pentapeptide) pyrophosphoryl-undecaprenol N-acetylglucosamine transferase, partial [Leptospiraceae bacterium]|nr:UDP-N-acetylglucosamine--N-acetylmuramyl-(pentapeptide) pyrophosphoryl-undecaprenol N-acetylglucosamine transferase [Leptospiraceae bacterium]
YFVKKKKKHDWGHLVIARSGAGVISECIAFGLPMILIPYPYASDNHQMENAKFCEECCGAKIIASKEEDSSILIKYLLEINQNPELLSKIYAQTCKDAKLQSSVNTIDFFFLSQDETSRK